MKQTLKDYFSPLFFALSWICWTIGHLACKALEANENSFKWVAFWYPIYNRFMLLSSNLQDVVGGISKYWPWAPTRGQ